MIFNKIKKAFSLTELLIVLVVVAVLFSAMLPIMTKRRSGGGSSFEPVWQYVNGSDQRDAYYDPGSTALTSTAFVGVDPNDLSGSSADVEPYSKMVIKANKNQNIIQFRYGAGFGTMTGIFAVDNKGNIISASKLNGTDANNSNAIIAGSNNTYNTVLGSGAFAKPTSATKVTAIGAKAAQQANSVAAGTYIGINSNQYGKATNNSTLIGANSGKTENGSIDSTVAIGANTLSVPTGTNTSSSGAGTVLAGAFTGNVGSYGYQNTILGSRYLGSTTAIMNTIIGYGAMEGAGKEAVGMTSVGYASCTSMQSSNSKYNTCIGHTSGGSYGSASTAGMGWEEDNYEHIFLGGVPQNNGVGGRAALEIHNIPRLLGMGHSGSLWQKTLSPTVVMNSNLVVRGNVYWPTIQEGKLSPHMLYMDLPTENSGKWSQKGADRCERWCDFAGKKRWRQKCKVWRWITYIVGAVTFVVGGILSCTPVAVGGWAVAGAGLAILALTDGRSNTRPLDGAASSFIQFAPQLSKTEAENASTYATARPTVCASAQKGYPDDSSSYCPHLHLSDVRLKDNLSENTDSIEKILLVMPYNYTFKNDKSAAPQVGVMAQDLQSYFPQSVQEGKDGYLSIRWDEIMFATINSTKSLDKVLSSLEDDVTNIGKENVQIAKEQKSTQKRIDELNKRLNKLEK